jgi:hypothetical protein
MLLPITGVLPQVIAGPIVVGALYLLGLSTALAGLFGTCGSSPGAWRVKAGTR